MNVEHSSTDDPARTVALLWRDLTAVPRKGPQRGLDLGAVVNAGISLADREGLAAVTMRRIAQELRVSPMTIYTYVPDKAELLDLMLDATYAAMPRAVTTGRPWRQRLSVVAEENRALFRDHPWAAGVNTQRPLLEPGAIAKYEHELAALDGLGLTDVDMDDKQWWAQAGPALASVIDDHAYPLSTRVGSAVGAQHGSAHSAEHAYRFGLERVLDGLAPLIENAGGT